MNNNAFINSFQPIKGLPCWGVYFQRQLNLSMNFGEPSLKIREPFVATSDSERVKQMASLRNVTVRGKWWLWIYCCHWRLDSGDSKLATGSSSNRSIERAIMQLDGQKLVSVEIKPDSGATRFVFDLGCVLSCRRFDRVTDDKLWTLYKPSGYVLSVHGDGTFCHQRGSDNADRHQPIYA